MRFASLALPLALLATVAACDLEYRIEADRHASPESPLEPASPGRGSGATDATCGVTIDRWKELLVIDRAVLQSREAKNDVEGAALSFRTQIEALAGGPAHAESFTLAWLESFATVTGVGAENAPIAPRPGVRSSLIDPWRAASYGAGSLMARAPFRLIAVVNRVDLREREDGCADDAGELRLVYTAVDPAMKNALAMTVIVELRYPSTRSARGWAEAWHALGALEGDAYVSGVAALVRDVTRSTPPESTRVRTNEAAFEDAGPLPWELRQFELDRAAMAPGARRLVHTLLATTPRDALAGSAALRSWAGENDRALEAGRVPDLPPAMRAGAATIPHATFRWSGLPVSEGARATFSAGTCNGCHGGERPTDTLRFQHVAPWDAPGIYYGASDLETQVSTYLHDPSHPEQDELARRGASMRTLLCRAPCALPSPMPSAPPSASPYDRHGVCR